MAGSKTIMQRLESFGHSIFYVTMGLFGHRGGSLLLRPVIFSYVLCSRKIHRTLAPYMQHRFPAAGFWGRWWATYRTVLSFGQVLVDRGWLGVKPGARMRGTFEGYDRLLELVAMQKGVVLLTAHVGNWQSALAHLPDIPVRVNALMQYDQGAAAKHYFDVRGAARPFAIIDADGPFGGMVESLTALQRGEIVTIMGDRYVKGSSATVDFYGEAVRLPDSAYMLAASAGAPVVVLLAAKTGRMEFELKVWDVINPEYVSRDERSAMQQECCRRFITAVEDYLEKYPYQWYNFFNFWRQ